MQGEGGSYLLLHRAGETCDSRLVSETAASSRRGTADATEHRNSEHNLQLHGASRGHGNHWHWEFVVSLIFVEISLNHQMKELRRGSLSISLDYHSYPVFINILFTAHRRLTNFKMQLYTQYRYHYLGTSTTTY